MAPKRKAATTSKSESATKKTRSATAKEESAPSTSTASTSKSTKSKPKPKPAAAPPPKKPTKKAASPAKKASTTSKSTKGKGKKEIVISSSEELESSEAEDASESESDVEIVEVKKPKKKAAPAKAKKASTEAVAKATTSKSKTKPKTKQNSPPTPSESSTTTSKKAKSTKKPVEVAKPPSFEESLKAWFEKYAEEDDKTTIGGEGVQKLFEEMDLPMEGVHTLLLGWFVKAAPGTFGSYKLADFETHFRPLNITSTSALKAHLVKLETDVYSSSSPDAPVKKSKKIQRPYDDDDSSSEGNDDDDSSNSLPPSTFAASKEFRSFYHFVFPFFREEGSKILPADTAIAVWGVVIAPKYELAKDFIEFATEQKEAGDKFKAVSSDVWNQLLSFCETVDTDLKGWTEEDAWPSTIDAFVEWKQKKQSTA